MVKVNPKIGEKDTLLENVEEVIGYAETFTVGYSSEILDATDVTNRVNKIQNYVPPIAWLVMTGEYQGIVEVVTYVFLQLPTWTIDQHRRSIFFPQGFFR